MLFLYLDILNALQVLQPLIQMRRFIVIWYQHFNIFTIYLYLHKLDWLLWVWWLCSWNKGCFLVLPIWSILWHLNSKFLVLLGRSFLIFLFVVKICFVVEYCLSNILQRYVFDWVLLIVQYTLNDRLWYYSTYLLF